MKKKKVILLYPVTATQRIFYIMPTSGNAQLAIQQKLSTHLITKFLINLYYLQRIFFFDIFYAYAITNTKLHIAEKQFFLLNDLIFRAN